MLETRRNDRSGPGVPVAHETGSVSSILDRAPSPFLFEAVMWYYALLSAELRRRQVVPKRCAGSGISSAQLKPRPDTAGLKLRGSSHFRSISLQILGKRVSCR